MAPATAGAILYCSNDVLQHDSQVLIHILIFFTEKMVEFCDFDVSESIFRRGLCLLSGPMVSDADVERIVNVIKAKFNFNGDDLDSF